MATRACSHNWRLRATSDLKCVWRKRATAAPKSPVRTASHGESPRHRRRASRPTSAIVELERSLEESRSRQLKNLAAVLQDVSDARFIDASILEDERNDGVVVFRHCVDLYADEKWEAIASQVCPLLEVMEGRNLISEVDFNFFCRDGMHMIRWGILQC